MYVCKQEELDGQVAKQRWSVMGDQKLIISSSDASEGPLSHWSRLHLQSVAPTNPHWARVVGYGPCSLCVIHKEGLCPSSRDINRLMMMMTMTIMMMMMIKN
jgi:hypothetical protein